MKFSELRPCDSCGGKIVPVFTITRSSIAIINSQKANQVAGMTQYFQGHLALAELMSGDPEVIVVAGDEHPELMTELIICQSCMMGDLLPLTLIMDNIKEKEE